MIYLLVFVNILCFSCQGIAIKLIRVTSLQQNMLSTSCFTFLAGVPLCIWIIINDMVVSDATLAWGVVMGTMFALATSTYSYALKIGPLSYTTFFFSASMLIPIVASVIIWNDPVTLLIVLGISLFLLAFYLIGVKGSGPEEKQASVRWLIFSLLSASLSGFSSLSIKLHQMDMNGTESFQLMGVGLTLCAVISFVIYFVSIGNDRVRILTVEHTPIIKENLKPILCAAILTALGNIIYSYLASRVPGTYLFPLVAGGNLLMTTVVSIVFFKEVVNKYGATGIFAGIAAIVLLNI